MFSAKGAEGKVDRHRKEARRAACPCRRDRARGFAVGDAVELKVDGERRRATRANHSATHLLHGALKRVLGPHVSQKGSLVAPDRLRFDFSHPKPVTPEELERIESQVNAIVRQNSDVSTRLMPTDEAIEAGAEALFGEKYGDEVRVLTMGDDAAATKPFSVELCGGTHVRRLGDIGLFTILAESAVASGVRRIDALTSEGARRHLAHQAELAREAANVLKTSPAELPQRVAQLADEKRKLERELGDARRALALAGPARSDEGDAVREIGGRKIVFRVVENVAAKDLKGLADDAKAKIGSGVVAFIAVADGKASLVVGVTDDLKDRISAVDLVRVGAEALRRQRRRRPPRSCASRRPRRLKSRRRAQGDRRKIGGSLSRADFPNFTMGGLDPPTQPASVCELSYLRPRVESLAAWTRGRWVAASEGGHGEFMRSLRHSYGLQNTQILLPVGSRR